jgi:hypothetical protein
MFKYWTKIVVGLFISLLINQSTFADTQNNQVTVSHPKPNCLYLNFSISPPVALYQALLPKQSFPDFVMYLANTSIQDFENNLKKTISSIEKKSTITNQDGSQIRLLNWQWPVTQAWQKSFKEQEILFISGTNSQGHPSYVDIKAEACSRRPIHRVQLSFHQAFYPLYVTISPTDQFWLTEQIPFAIADFF